MATKYYPYPEDLSSRKVARKNQMSERLKRMTDRETHQWEQEAYRLSMAEAIKENIKPTYLVLAAKISALSLECDSLFNNEINTVQLNS